MGALYESTRMSPFEPGVHIDVEVEIFPEVTWGKGLLLVQVRW